MAANEFAKPRMVFILRFHCRVNVKAWLTRHQARVCCFTSAFVRPVGAIMYGYTKEASSYLLNTVYQDEIDRIRMTDVVINNNQSVSLPCSYLESKSPMVP